MEPKWMEPLNTNSPPEIYSTSVLEPGESRDKLLQFDTAKAKEPEGVARHGVFDVIAKMKNVTMQTS